MYQKDNGWNGNGRKWSVHIAAYSKKRVGTVFCGHVIHTLPVPNDDVRAIRVPAGLVVRMTDAAGFTPGTNGSFHIVGPRLVNIKELNQKLAGKVSSIFVWRPVFQ